MQRLICKAATEAQIGPDRVKFKRTVRILRRRVADPVFSSEYHQRALARIMAGFTSSKNLNPRHRHRSYPRVVKRARHNSYRVKKPSDTGIRHDRPATIRLANPVLTSTAA